MLKRLFDKREALRILRTNSSEEVFQISKALDGQRVATHNFESKIAIIRSKTHRKEGSSPEAKQQGRKRNIAFRGAIQPSVSIIKEALLKKWNLIQNRPLPCQNLKEPH